MELNQARYFLAVARLLNFTRAAEQCNISQPALTKSVQKLEHELGGTLIHRERQLTQLTDLGKLILPIVERTLAAEEAVRVHAREFQLKGIAPLKIGLASCISAALFMKQLSVVARTIPGLRVELIETSSEHLPELLLEGKINVAIGGSSGCLSERIDRWRLFEERFMVLVCAGDPLSKLSEIPIEALTKTIWLERIDCEISRHFFRTYFPLGKQLAPGHRGQHESHLQNMVAAGLGIMLAPEHAPHLPSLILRPIAGNPLRREVELLVVAGRRYSPSLEEFVKVMRSHNWQSELEASPSTDGETETEYNCSKLSILSTKPRQNAELQSLSQQAGSPATVISLQSTEGSRRCG